MANVTGSRRVESFPFDSKADGYDADGYPVYDRAVGALTLRTVFRQFFTDGVFGTPADALQISKGSSGLVVNINPGVFIIRGAMARVGDGDEPVTLTLSDTPPQGNVAYGIMLRYDENDTASIGRSLSLVAVAGEASSSAQPPAPDQSTPGICEYRLGYVTVPSGMTDLSGATVTNEKGLSVCPYAAPFDNIDLSEIVADARAQAQETTDAFLHYAQQYYDLVASAIDDTTAGMLMEMINDINAHGLVDNVTTSSTSDGKVQVKDMGITSEKIEAYAVGEQHLDNFLRQKLGLLDTSSWDASQYTDYVGSLASSADQAEFISGNLTSSIIGGWSAQEIITFDASLKDSSASKAFVDTINLGDLDWSKIGPTVAGITNNHEAAGSAFLGKRKTMNVSGYGDVPAIVWGVNHDEDMSGVKIPLSMAIISEVPKSHGNVWSSTGWVDSPLRSYLNGAYLSAIESGARAVLKVARKTFSTGWQSTEGNGPGYTHSTCGDTVSSVAASEFGSNDSAYVSSNALTLVKPEEGARYEYLAMNKQGGITLGRFSLRTSAEGIPLSGTGKAFVGYPAQGEWGAPRTDSAVVSGYVPMIFI